MYKKLGTVVVLSSFAANALAQNSVTLYGVIDEGIDYQTNAKVAAGVGKSKYSMDSGGGIQGSRWGLKGSEDLGGDLKAVFQIENGFNLNTGALGQNGLEFGRQAYVGLSSLRYGSVTLGRQYDSAVDFVGPYIFADQFAPAYAALPDDVNNLNNAYRVNNAIKYTSPALYGFSFGGLYSLGGVTGSLARDQIYSLGASYASGPASFAVAYLHVNQPNTSFFSNSALTSGQLAAGGSSISSNVIYGGYANANSYQTAAVGARYRVGSTSISAVYTNTKFSGLQSSLPGLSSTAGGQGTAVFNAAELNVAWRLTPALQVGSAYSYTRGSKVMNSAGAPYGGATYNQVSVSADYSISKQTDFYVAGVYQKASGVDSTGSAATAQLNGSTASANDRLALVRVALRHKF